MADLYPQLPLVPPALQLGIPQQGTPQTLGALWNQAMGGQTIGAINGKPVPGRFTSLVDITGRGALSPPLQAERQWNQPLPYALQLPTPSQPQAEQPPPPGAPEQDYSLIQQDLSGQDLTPRYPAVEPPEMPPAERYTGPDQVPATALAFNVPGAAVTSSGYPPGLEPPPVAGVRSDAAIWGMLAAGLGILANNSGNYGQFGPAVGKGGLIGLNTFLQQRQQEQNNAFVAQRQYQLQQLQNAQIENYRSEAMKREYEIEQDRKLGNAMQAAFNGQPTQGATAAQAGPGPATAAAPAAPSGAPGVTGGPGASAPAPAAAGSLVAGTTPQSPGSPQFPVQAGSGGIFDPQTYARVAQAAFGSGTSKGAQMGKEWASVALQAEGLRLQGYHTIDAGDHQEVWRAGEHLGDIKKGMTMWEQFKAFNEIVNTQREAILARHVTGQDIPYLAGSGPAPKTGVLPGGLTGQTGAGAGPMSSPSPTAPGGVPGALRPGAPPQISDDPRQVFQGLTPKQMQEQLGQQMTQSRQEIQKENDGLPATQQAIQAANSFMALNAKTPTGRAIGSEPLKTAREYFRGEDAANMQEMSKIEAAWQSSGTGLVGLNNVSNYERGLVGKANMSTANEKVVNDNIGKVVIQGALNAQDKIAFKEWFFGKYQTLNRSDGWWNDYINTNPTFVREPGSTALVQNASKMSWQDYAGQRMQGGISIPVKPGTANTIDAMRIKPDMQYIMPTGLMPGSVLLDLVNRSKK